MLAAKINLPLCTNEEAEQQGYLFILCPDEQGLFLQQLGAKSPGPVRCDFAQGAARHRRLYGGGRKQDIAKAVGLNKPHFKPQVLDLTAGLGQDGFVLASLGASVTLLERHPVIHALLESGLEQARNKLDDAQLQTIVTRMALINADAKEYLNSHTEVPAADIIYLDPMFPPREKSAKVKKEMQLFHQLIGEDTAADDLLALALVKAKYRVVVKRPAYAPPLSGEEPNYAIKGKSTRFDIYTLKKLPV